eukprot:1266822-Amorphochlora_amoeboformis.AAC.1
MRTFPSLVTNEFIVSTANATRNHTRQAKRGTQAQAYHSTPLADKQLRAINWNPCAAYSRGVCAGVRPGETCDDR